MSVANRPPRHTQASSEIGRRTRRSPLGGGRSNAVGVMGRTFVAAT